MKITGANIIGNIESSDKTSSFTTWDPAKNQKTSYTFYEANEDEINQALKIAEKAFRPYSELPISQRIEFLQNIHSNILDLGSDLIDVFCEESGLGFQRAIAERKRTLWQIELCIETLKKVTGSKLPLILPLKTENQIRNQI